MLKIGLTGGIGSGKTAVSDLFSDLGIDVIDTDIISRQLINNDATILKMVVEAFSDDVLNSNNAIDRKKLAGIVFSDKAKKQALEKILHPRIRKEVNKQIHNLSQLATPPAYLIVVIPLLLETGFDDIVDRTLVVMADEDRRIDRVRQRDNRKPDEILLIISHQVNDEERINAADDIIENNSDFNHLQTQVHRLDKKYRQIPH